MPGNGKSNFGKKLLLAWVLSFFCFTTALGDDQSDRRVLVGLKLFPALLAADLDIGRKVAPDGRLHLLVIYQEQLDAAERAAARLREAKAVRDIPLFVQTARYSELHKFQAEPPAAVFVVEWAPDAMPSAVEFGNDTGRIVFSPFRGDVTLGAHAGVYVGDRILPLVNPAALRASGIQLKPFFLEVARTHE